MTDPSKPETVCASCGASGTGKYCASCGAALESFACPGCGAALSPGARFCHECGRPAGAAAPSSSAPAPAASAASSLPWIVAAIALVTLLAFFAGSAFNKQRGSTLDAPQNALPQAGLDDRGAGAEGAVRGPDISQLSPEERADRLFNRVMLLSSQGKSDSVLFFAPMAINAFQMLSPMTADQRYDMGRIAEVAGALPLAKAQVDTILASNSSHLLGLILGARIAALENDSASRRSYETRFLAARDAETARRLPEYERHADDISSATTDARRAVGSTK
jgi:hypothetical protein